LMVASHIVPWAADLTNRMNPRNGLCLCGTHDLAFENGVLLVLPNCTVRIADRFQEFRGSEPAEAWLFRYAAKPLHLPERWPPDPELLARRYETMTATGTAV
jgi:putative restriction endonuclease